jgi:ubiquinone biosynthesis protein UbiJ
MATQSPFSFLEDVFRKVSTSLQPPEWAVQEVQRRIVLLLNHVLMQEPEAMARLARQKSRVLLFHWREFQFKLQFTPAGLLDLAAADTPSDLTLSVTEVSPVALVQAALAGDKPAVRIEGDVQLAADINWLVDHVRWDIEEDLARIIGDAPAHGLAQAARQALATLRQWLTPSRGAQE